MMIQIAIVEDIEALRETMASLIQMEKDLLCVYRFSNAEEALATLSEDPVDVVLMDIHLPGMNGIDCVRQLKQKCPQMQFMMSTIFHDDENIFNALKAGASGYLLKSDEPEKIIAAIRDLNAGGSPMDAQIARRVIESFHKRQSVNDSDPTLTKREYELLVLLSKGFRYKEIANQLYISIETVRKHVNNIYRKLQVQSRIEAVNKAFGERLPKE